MNNSVNYGSRTPEPHARQPPLYKYESDIVKAKLGRSKESVNYSLNFLIKGKLQGIKGKKLSYALLFRGLEKK